MVGNKREESAKENAKENIVPIGISLTPQRALSLIRTLITEDKVIWHRHCLRRMDERDISTIQVLNCLQKEYIKEAPFLSNKHGGCHEVAVVKVTAGEKIKVVIGLLYTQKMLVITAIQDKMGRFSPTVQKEPDHDQEKNKRVKKNNDKKGKSDKKK